MIKKFFCLLWFDIWTSSLQDAWQYLWSKTEVDEKLLKLLRKLNQELKL